ncbi:outer membrane protein assembly factor BamB/tRNA A-37 threonylcarbamoyl transferase component Bud32 [Catenulispora sp. GP43]|uniref:protein kinase domain-containing protein n=1 Tax=Catenulispora sp. GP43 TaxID=3156263 RepID=UPI003514CD61
MVGAPGAPGSVMGPLIEGDPRRVGPYTTIGRLGVGELGPLYGARSDDGRAVAVRTLRPDLLADQTVKARLAADIAAARTVAGPYVAPVLAADLESPAPWLASEYVAGVALAKAVADHGPLPEPALLTLAAGLAEALAALHAAGVMHGDLRPGTVLLTPEGPRVVDFALARAFDGAAEIGMAGFLAPEQALGRTVTPSADMFALGSTLFFATTGRAPFGEGRAEEVKKRVAKSSPVLGKLPAALSELIRGCFQKDANSRAQPQQVLEYVRRRAPIPLGSGWLPAAVAADVRAAVAEGFGGGGGGAAAGEDANATIVVAPVVPVVPVAPVAGGQAPGFAAAATGSMAAVPQQADGSAAFGPAPGGPATGPMPAIPQQADGGAAFAPAPASAPGGQIPDFGPAPSGYGAAPTGPQQPAGNPAPSRRNLLLALGGAAVVVGGGTAVALGLGGSSGTTTAADAQPSAGSVGAVPSVTKSSAPEPGMAPPSASDTASSAGRRPLPPGGPLSPPVGAAGTLQGPDAAPFWQLPDVGTVTSLAAGGGVLVVAAANGVSGYDLGSNAKWGPVRAAGVPGSGNGVVVGGVVCLIVASDAGAAGGDVLALDVETGAQRWRTPIPQGSAGVRIGGALNGMVFVVGLAGPDPFLWALDAASGRPVWQKSGVEFATLAVPADGTQVLTAGASAPNTSGTYMAWNSAGQQVWTHPLKTAADYSQVSLSKAAYVGDQYVLLFTGAPNGDTLVGGSVASGQPTWSTVLPEPAGDTGSLSLIARSPDANSVVALSRHGVYAVDAKSGNVLWHSQGPGSFTIASDAGAPQLADGNVYVCDDQGSWWSVDLAGGRTRWKYTVAGFVPGVDPVWTAVPGGVVVADGRALVMIAANG